jgi:hypothetical protein
LDMRNGELLSQGEFREAFAFGGRLLMESGFAEYATAEPGACSGS